MASLVFRRARRLLNDSFMLASKTYPSFLSSSPKPHFSSLTSRPIFSASKPCFAPSKPLFNLSTFHSPKPIFSSKPLLSKSFGTKPTLPVPIKVVSGIDLQYLSIVEYEESCKFISYRFPLVDRLRFGQSGMRRTVRDNEFSMDRNFFFIKVVYGSVGDLFLLFCTKTTDMVGVKLDEKLILFDDSLYEMKGDISVLADVCSNQVVHVDIRPSEVVKYLSPIAKDFKSAVVFIKKFVNEPSLGDTYSDKRDHIEQCLGFLYDVLFRGVVSTWTKSLVIDSLSLGRPTLGEEMAGEGSADSFPLEPLFKKREWEEISSAWFLGNKMWMGYKIEEEVLVVKASKLQPEAVLVTGMELYEQHEKVKRLEKAKTDFFEGDMLGDYCSRKAALEAWDAAKAGFDEDEFFEMANYPKGIEEKAKLAFQMSTKLYFR